MLHPIIELMYLHDYNGKAGWKNSPEKNDVMQWHMQASNITNSIKIGVYLNLPALRETNVLMYKFHVGD